MAVRLLLVVLLIAGSYEGYRLFGLYKDLNSAKGSLSQLRNDLDLRFLTNSNSDVEATRNELLATADRLAAARGTLAGDPVYRFARILPVAGKQAKGLDGLLAAAQVSTIAGLNALEVVNSFGEHQDDPQLTSIQEGMLFLQSQESRMWNVQVSLNQMRSLHAALPDGLIGPLGSAATELGEAITRLEGLVDGYDRANGLLPELLGYNGRRHYLVLPQNDSELMPSGGLISSYAIATFNEGRLEDIQLEYFGTLFDRWQTISQNEYIEPPAPLKNYLLKDFSWGLGEAGWYPDFPTTAELARTFVSKGGKPATDGVIAIDMQFVRALLELLGPVEVSEYGVTVTPENFEEVTLEQTRDENYVAGRPKKAFLSFLARDLLSHLFSTDKNEWVDMLKLLDRMGKERHLQINFLDAEQQALSTDYGFSGTIVQAPGDYLLIADASVNSTKLNLILDTKASLGINLNQDGSATSTVKYEISNPFPEWRQGREPSLVRALMLQGVYGSYIRVFAQPEAYLQDVLLNGKPAGAEQVGPEVGKKAFGRYFTVAPGATENVAFTYETPGIVERLRDGSYRYQLYIQKEPGTKTTPLRINVALPKGASVREIMLDGKPYDGLQIDTDLRTDRTIEVIYSLR